MTPERLNFGIFMAPFHRTGENPTLSLQRDLELIQWLDDLGFDEAWIGEHHSAGWETIASPEVFIGVAAERTKRIRLGTGVVSIPSYSEQGLAALETQWKFCEEAADKAGRPTPDRRDWRVVMPFHLADSREEAITDIEDGLLTWNNDYFVGTIGSPVSWPASSGREMA